MYLYRLAIKTYIIISSSQNTISEPELSSSQGELTKKKQITMKKVKNYIIIIIIIIIQNTISEPELSSSQGELAKKKDK